MRGSGTLVAGGGVLAALLLVGACSSGGGSSTTASTRRAGTTTTTNADISGVQVNLTLTGDRTATIQGAKGTCTIPGDGAAPTYEFDGKDYPALGTHGSVVITGPLVVNGTAAIPPSAKVILDDVGLVSPTDGAGITLANSNRTVMVNVPVSGGVGQSADNNFDDPSNSVKAMLAGSIRCTSGGSSRD
jgi:hypothetical protein